MKGFLLLVLITTTSLLHAQSKKELLKEIEALKNDTTRLNQEIVNLNKKLDEEQLKFDQEKRNADYNQAMARTKTDKLKIEIDQLSTLFVQTYEKCNNIEREKGTSNVLFGEENEFEGYNARSGRNVQTSMEMRDRLMPFGKNRVLQNKLDLRNFSFAHTTRIQFKVELGQNGRIVRLWCNENRSDIKNREVIRLIGEEVIRQAQYNKAEQNERSFPGTCLIELVVTIPTDMTLYE